MFWADEIAEKVIARGKPLYRVHDYKTPSGRIHVGALRGVVLHNVVARAIAAKKAEVNYLYGFDDYDPMDGFPVYLPEEFRQHMGKPLSEIPSPEPGFANFGEFYAKEFLTVINLLGINPEIVWASEMYKAGAYNEAIRISLDNAAKVREIYKRISKAERRDDWYALSVICPQCGKIGTTRVSAWDGEQVSFTCEPAMVKWAEGCGYEGKTSPFDGKAKLPWKVEWAAKWFIYGEDFETAGKDHMTKNGSFDVAAAIAQEVYKVEPPIGRQYPYEWLLVGGKKMSSSKGVGASAKEVAELLPTHLLHFFIAKGKPSRHLDFEPGGNTMPLLYDEYDQAIKAYHTEPESDAAKIVAYTKTEAQTTPQYTMKFSKVAFLSQMPGGDIWKVAADEKGSDLDEAEKAELQERLDYAKKWLAEFAPDELKFELQVDMPVVTINATQKQFLTKIHDFLLTDVADGAAIHEKIHALKNEYELSPADAFGLLYQLFLGKASGPQAGWFLAALERPFVIDRLKTAIAE
jgi:lysyl-tRNA synthetase class 1